MRKIVLGIIALVSVQFAFVTYMMVLQPAPTELTGVVFHREPVPASPDRVRIDELTSSDAQPEVAAPVTGTPAARTERSSTAMPGRGAGPEVRRESKPAFPSIGSKAAAPGAFESVVIRYNPSPNTSDCEIRGTPATKKRSFVAKAAPVFKQPWKWMKAVGSKLN